MAKKESYEEMLQKLQGVLGELENGELSLEESMKSYEEVNGPLQVADADFNNWNWINGPWPWEGGIR